MRSTPHRANILSSAYTQVGVGAVVDSAGIMWVSEIFRRPSGAVAPAPKPVVTQTAKPKAAPAHRAAAPKPTVAPTTVAPRPATVPTRASRDLARVSLDAARRLAQQLDDAPGVQGYDPVSRLLDFVALNATLS
jgi:uncharacterized protein YkwD